MLFAGRDHEIPRLGLLQHEPLGVHVVAGMAPVAPRIQIPEVDAGLQSFAHPREAARDLARHERLAAARRLVVEEDPAAREQPVRLAIVDRYPVRVELRYAIRRTRVERS